MSRAPKYGRKTSDWLLTRIRLFEKRLVTRLIRKCEGQVAVAARMAGRNRTEFYRLLQRHGINPNLYRITKEERAFRKLPSCNLCFGTGKIERLDCPRCSGTGKERITGEVLATQS